MEANFAFTRRDPTLGELVTGIKQNFDDWTTKYGQNGKKNERESSIGLSHNLSCRLRDMTADLNLTIDERNQLKKINAGLNSHIDHLERELKYKNQVVQSGHLITRDDNFILQKDAEITGLRKRLQTSESQRELTMKCLRQNVSGLDTVVAGKEEDEAFLSIICHLHQELQKNNTPTCNIAKHEAELKKAEDTIQYLRNELRSHQETRDELTLKIEELNWDIRSEKKRNARIESEKEKQLRNEMRRYNSLEISLADEKRKYANEHDKYLEFRHAVKFQRVSESEKFAAVISSLNTDLRNEKEKLQNARACLRKLEDELISRSTQDIIPAEAETEDSDVFDLAARYQKSFETIKDMKIEKLTCENIISQLKKDLGAEKKRCKEAEKQLADLRWEMNSDDECEKEFDTQRNRFSIIDDKKCESLLQQNKDLKEKLYEQREDLEGKIKRIAKELKEEKANHQITKQIKDVSQDPNPKSSKFFKFLGKKGKKDHVEMEKYEEALQKIKDLEYDIANETDNLRKIKELKKTINSLEDELHEAKSQRSTQGEIKSFVNDTHSTEMVDKAKYDELDNLRAEREKDNTRYREEISLLKSKLLQAEKEHREGVNNLKKFQKQEFSSSPVQLVETDNLKAEIKKENIQYREEISLLKSKLLKAEREYREEVNDLKKCQKQEFSGSPIQFAEMDNLKAEMKKENIQYREEISILKSKLLQVQKEHREDINNLKKSQTQELASSKSAAVQSTEIKILERTIIDLRKDLSLARMNNIKETTNMVDESKYEDALKEIEELKKEMCEKQQKFEDDMVALNEDLADARGEITCLEERVEEAKESEPDLMPVIQKAATVEKSKYDEAIRKINDLTFDFNVDKNDYVQEISSLKQELLDLKDQHEEEIQNLKMNKKMISYDSTASSNDMEELQMKIRDLEKDLGLERLKNIRTSDNPSEGDFAELKTNTVDKWQYEDVLKETEVLRREIAFEKKATEEKTKELINDLVEEKRKLRNAEETITELKERLDLKLQRQRRPGEAFNFLNGNTDSLLVAKKLSVDKEKYDEAMLQIDKLTYKLSTESTVYEEKIKALKEELSEAVKINNEAKSSTLSNDKEFQNEKKNSQAQSNELKKLKDTIKGLQCSIDEEMRKSKERLETIKTLQDELNTRNETRKFLQDHSNIPQKSFESKIPQVEKWKYDEEKEKVDDLNRELKKADEKIRILNNEMLKEKRKFRKAEEEIEELKENLMQEREKKKRVNEAFGGLLGSNEKEKIQEGENETRRGQRRAGNATECDTNFLGLREITVDEKKHVTQRQPANELIFPWEKKVEQPAPQSKFPWDTKEDTVDSVQKTKTQLPWNKSEEIKEEEVKPVHQEIKQAEVGVDKKKYEAALDQIDQITTDMNVEKGAFEKEIKLLKNALHEEKISHEETMEKFENLKKTQEGMERERQNSKMFANEKQKLEERIRNMQNDFNLERNKCACLRDEVKDLTESLRLEKVKFEAQEIKRKEQQNPLLCVNTNMENLTDEQARRYLGKPINKPAIEKENEKQSQDIVRLKAQIKDLEEETKVLKQKLKEERLKIKIIPSEETINKESYYRVVRENDDMKDRLKKYEQRSKALREELDAEREKLKTAKPQISGPAMTSFMGGCASGSSIEVNVNSIQQITVKPTSNDEDDFDDVVFKIKNLQQELNAEIDAHEETKKKVVQLEIDKYNLSPRKPVTYDFLVDSNAAKAEKSSSEESVVLKKLYEEAQQTIVELKSDPKKFKKKNEEAIKKLKDEKRKYELALKSSQEALKKQEKETKELQHNLSKIYKEYEALLKKYNQERVKHGLKPKSKKTQQEIATDESPDSTLQNEIEKLVEQIALKDKEIEKGIQAQMDLAKSGQQELTEERRKMKECQEEADKTKMILENEMIKLKEKIEEIKQQSEADERSGAERNIDLRAELNKMKEKLTTKEAANLDKDRKICELDDKLSELQQKYDDLTETLANVQKMNQQYESEFEMYMKVESTDDNEALVTLNELKASHSDQRKNWLQKETQMEEDLQKLKEANTELELKDEKQQKEIEKQSKLLGDLKRIVDESHYINTNLLKQASEKGVKLVMPHPMPNLPDANKCSSEPTGPVPSGSQCAAKQSDAKPSVSLKVKTSKGRVKLKNIFSKK